MPIYQYRCQACGHELELLQKMGDPPPETCPNCGQEALKKRISMTTFRLKGSGWYETDFKGKGEKKRFLAEGGCSDGRSEEARSIPTHVGKSPLFRREIGGGPRLRPPMCHLGADPGQDNHPPPSPG